MTTETVSPDDIESTRLRAARIESEILRGLARVTQAHAAACMGVSASTVSRMVEDLQRWSQLIAAAELQVASCDSMVVDPNEIVALESMSEKYLQIRREMRLKGQGR